jgi:hypothetical protein
MQNYPARFITRTISAIILILSLTSHLVAETKQNCNSSIGNQNIFDCGTPMEIVDQLNLDIQKVFALGSAAALSQPPLVKMPTIAQETPVSFQDKNNQIIDEELIRPPLKAERSLGVKKDSLISILKVLDLKGKKHLGRCLKKLSDGNREKHFSKFKRELKEMEKFAKAHSSDSSNLKEMLTKSPSKEQCINYLDFILMAS